MHSEVNGRALTELFHGLLLLEEGGEGREGGGGRVREVLPGDCRAVGPLRGVPFQCQENAEWRWKLVLFLSNNPI